MSDYDPRRARAKRPLPIWMDAFLRDTQHLDADEVGAYFLILGAMWTTPDCSLPHDDRKLARVSRTTVTTFKRRIGPAVLPLMDIEDGKVISWRLRKEACFAERSVAQQHCRKTGNNLAKLLKGLGWGLSADKTTDDPGMHPTQQPNNLHITKPSASMSNLKNLDQKPKKTDFLEIFADDLENSEPEPKKTKPKAKKGTRLANDWFLPKDWGDWAVEYGLTTDQIKNEADTFRDYWIGVSGAKGVKLDWQATWRNWIRKSNNGRQANGNGNSNNKRTPISGGMARSATAAEIADRSARYAERRAKGSGT